MRFLKNISSLGMGSLLLILTSLQGVVADPVPLDCSGDDCGKVPLELPGSEGMPPASQAEPNAQAPGHPVDSGEPTPGAIDPIAPVEPPSPSK